jgi:hypothetical protein
VCAVVCKGCWDRSGRGRVLGRGEGSEIAHTLYLVTRAA